MQIIVCIIGGLTLLWMLYLCRRSVMPRLPGQLGVYRVPSPGAAIGVTLMNTMLIGFAIAAAKEALPMSAIMLAVAVMYTWLLSRNGLLSIAYSEGEIAVRDLFGPMHVYCWADVSAYTVRREETRGRFSHTYDMYRLTLPDRVLTISNAEDAGRALLQVFEQGRPEMKAVRLPQQ